MGRVLLLPHAPFFLAPSHQLVTSTVTLIIASRAVYVVWGWIRRRRGGGGGRGPPAQAPRRVVRRQPHPPINGRAGPGPLEGDTVLDADEIGVWAG